MGWEPLELERVVAAIAGPYPTKEGTDELAAFYAGSPAGLDDPYAFPADGDLSDLPAALVLTSELDLRRSSGDGFARKLGASGVDVEHAELADAQHAVLNDPLSPLADRAINMLAAWVLNRRT